MFKSTKDYDSAVLKVLTSIRDTDTFPEATTDFSEVDLGDVVNLCYQQGYIDGVVINRNLMGNYRCDGKPRLTYQGLNFIEKFNQ